MFKDMDWVTPTPATSSHPSENMSSIHPPGEPLQGLEQEVVAMGSFLG